MSPLSRDFTHYRGRKYDSSGSDSEPSSRSRSPRHEERGRGRKGEKKSKHSKNESREEKEQRKEKEERKCALYCNQYSSVYTYIFHVGGRRKC